KNVSQNKATCGMWVVRLIMKIIYTKVFVNDQDKALKFYTQILGFLKNSDIVAGDYRWLTVVSPEDQNGTELILELNDNPAAKTYQKAIFEQSIPATNFGVSDVHIDYERLKNLGVKFTIEPSEVMENVTIAVLDDTCGNLIQIQTVG
ncbi:MAG: VOC family protein, partial [Methanothrix soehngenii]|nr:VOC family protein [Methanothrix soehngenii]